MPKVGFMAGVACAIAGVMSAPPCLGQETRASTFAVDSASSIDRVVDEAGNATTGVIIDAFVSARIGPLDVVARPWTQRLANGEWNRQLWLAAVRYERAGTLGLRLEGGLIPAPVGLANLTLRPHLNPTIAQPSSLFQTLPAPEPQSPRLTLLGPVYPFGVNATLSGSHWDARAAVIDTSPLRGRRIFASANNANPPRLMNIVMGGGITPITGMRFGASVTHGNWRKGGETPADPEDRDATVVTVESEVSFRYTKLSGEWVRDMLDITSGQSVAWGWFVQGQQTLTPRWFVAGRVERMSAATGVTGISVQQQFTGTEETIGFRLTPEITLRASHRARQGFGRTGFDQTAAVSAVWWKRWI